MTPEKTASVPIIELTGRKDSILSASFLPPNAINIRFADGFAFDLSTSALEMDSLPIRWSTTIESLTGESVILKTTLGEQISIDAGTLRYLSDPEYARECEATLKSLQFTKDELVDLVRDNPPPSEWYEELARYAKE